MKPVKAWAVLCPEPAYICAFESKDAALEMKSRHDAEGHGKHTIARVEIREVKK